MGKKQIVIIESNPSDNLTKIAYVLRKRGYETVCISLINSIDKEFIYESYDKLISFDLKFFKISPKNLLKILIYSIRKTPKILIALYKIKKLNPNIVIGRATPNWLCALSMRYFKKFPFIYFPYDIRSFTHTDAGEAFSLGVPKFEIKAEAYCFKNAEGIIHKGNEKELNYLNESFLGEKIKIKCPNIFFFPYCLKRFFVPIDKNKKISLKDKKIHIVFAGHLASDKNWLNGMNKILSQKIYLHLYGKTNNLTKSENNERIKKSHRNLLNNKFLFLHGTLSQKDLSKEISKYDYGTYTYSSIHEKDMKNASGNKISSYLEAGLPIMCAKEYTSAVKILARYKIGVIYDPKKIGQIRKELERNKPSKFEKNILKAREELSIENHIKRLEKFFEKVIEYKKVKLSTARLYGIKKDII